ncbi:MAG: EAL domain-containing protein [Sulfurospirillum sp.]
MQKKYKGSIKKELLGIILSIVMVAIAVGYAIFLNKYINNEQKRDISLMKTISKIISQDVAKIMYMDNISVAADVTTQLKSFSNLDSIVLYKKNGEPLFQYFKDNKTHQVGKFDKNMLGKAIVQNDKLRLYSKLFYKGTFLVSGEYSFKIETLKEIFLGDAPFLALILCIMLFLAYILSWYYAKKFTAPILSLVKFLENIKDEKFLKDRIKTMAKNEFGVLYDEINTMLERMQESYGELKIAAVAFETQNPIVITDSKARILRTNRAFEKITGYKESEVIGNNPSVLKSGKHDVDFYKDMYQKLLNNHYWSGGIINRKKDGSLYHENLTIQTVLHENSDVAYYIASFTDTTKQKEAEEKLKFLEHYDVLTGLANRNLLRKELELEIDKNDEDKICGFICCDIENFKMVNEGYGFEFGNRLLQAVAQRLKENIKEAKYIAKIGANEFFLWFEYNKKDIKSINLEIRLEAQKISQTVSKSFQIDNKSIGLLFHIGISISDAIKTKTARDIIKEAVSAINIAKESGYRISFYDKTYQDKSIKHLDMYSEMLIAIKEEQFELFYQLQNNDKKEVVGAEALMRWRRSKDEIVSPIKFIPLLEKSGLILKLSNWIAETACKQLAIWQKNEKTKNLTVSINVSPKEFYSENFLLNIKNNLQKYNIPRNKLKVELVESILVEKMDLVLEKMEGLRKAGVKISLDDFGTGYSSLSYLKKLPINQIKIDRVFIKNVRENRKDRAIVESILLLKDAFGVNVIAEGVETKEDFEFLNTLGCTLYQGFYFSKPKPINEIDI